jgi:hypothetical protein
MKRLFGHSPGRVAACLGTARKSISGMAIHQKFTAL